jgi:hypothetical protein
MSASRRRDLDRATFADDDVTYINAISPPRG